MQYSTIILPGGVFDSSGQRCRQARIRALTGREEELLLHTNMPAAARVTELLVRCVESIEGQSTVDAELIRSLLVADRQYLLLRLRALTFGDEVQTSLLCPFPNCGEQIAVDFRIEDLPLHEPADLKEFHTLHFSPETSGEILTVRFRLPNGDDQETLAPVLDQNESRAARALLSRCLLDNAESGRSAKDQLDRLPPRACLEIEAYMESAAPRVDLEMQAACHACARSFIVPFHVQDFFFGELHITRDLLYREVHYLAYHYHWSEAEILALPREKRRLYQDILSQEFEQIERSVHD